MVDARLPAEWLGSLRIDKLSDRAFRVLAGALMWCNGQGTDGAVPARYTKYLHPDGDDQDAFNELVDAGLWAQVEDGYLLAGWSDDLHQSTADEIHRYREAAKRRQKAYRDRQRSADADMRSAAVNEPRAMRHVTHNATRDVTAHVGSGSASETPRKSAYATRNVTRHADSPFCPKHPTGTLDPCGACARARTAHEARQDTIAGLGWDCTIDGHKLVVDGTCAVCSYRPT